MWLTSQHCLTSSWNVPLNNARRFHVRKTISIFFCKKPYCSISTFIVNKNSQFGIPLKRWYITPGKSINDQGARSGMKAEWPSLHLLLKPFIRPILQMRKLKATSPGSHRKLSLGLELRQTQDPMLLTTEGIGEWWGLQVGTLRVVATRRPQRAWCCLFQMQSSKILSSDFYAITAHCPQFQEGSTAGAVF